MKSLQGEVGRHDGSNCWVVQGEEQDIGVSGVSLAPGPATPVTTSMGTARGIVLVKALVIPYSTPSYDTNSP